MENLIVRLKYIPHFAQNRLSKVAKGSIAFALFLFLIVLAYWLLFRDTPSTYTVATNTLPMEFVWSYISDEAIKVPPIGNGDIVVIWDEQGQITAFENQTGTIKWIYDTNESVDFVSDSLPKWVIAEDLLVMSIAKNQLLAINIETGEKVWQTRLLSDSRVMPNIIVIDDVIVVSGWDYVGGYRLSDGTLGWEMAMPQRSFYFTFECPFIVFLPTSSVDFEKTVCMLVDKKIQVIDVSLESMTDEMRQLPASYAPIVSANTPVFYNGIIFSNPSPQPTVHVFDTVQNKQYTLPGDCQKERVTYPITNYRDQVLAVTGCDQAYVLDISRLQEAPDWIFQSSVRLLSPFVTINGEVGYVLNEDAEVIGIDLRNGDQIGKAALEPGFVEERRLFNDLIVNPPYLYVLLGAHTLMVFNQPTP